MEEQFVEVKLDAMRERGGSFWHASNRSAWPIETKQFIFLANVVNIIGETLFPEEWSGEEPRDWTTPILDGGRAYIAQGSDSTYAMAILRDNRPDLSISRIADWSPYEHPLQDSDWRIATEIYVNEIAPLISASSNRMHRVIREIVEAAASGELATVTRNYERGTYRPSPAILWNSELAFCRFFDCQMNPDLPFDSGMSVYDMLSGKKPRLLPQREWIFVAASDVTSFVARLSQCGDREELSSDPESFVESDAKLTSQQRAIADAITELWSGAIPDTLMAKDRDDAIMKRVRANGGRVPTDRSIQRYLKKQSV